MAGVLDGQDEVPGASAYPEVGDDLEAADEDDEPPSWEPGLAPLHWAGWSPRLRGSSDGPAVDLTVDVDRVVWAWRCDTCGAASVDADDFEVVTGDVSHRHCECGGDAVRTPAVYCTSCDTLILLRSTDPDASAVD